MTHAWRQATIGDACRLVNGGTPKTKVSKYWDGPHAWIAPAEMGGRDSPYISDTRRSLSEDGLAKCSATLLPPYSVIMSSRAPIGHLAINEVPMATNQGCKGLVPSDGLHHKFLYYYLYSVVDLLNELGTGATFKELSANKLRGVPIPVPPPPEQERIVAVLDEAFAAITTATANAETNLTNARELFEGYFLRVFTARAHEWPHRNLAELLELGWIADHMDGNHGGDYPRKHEFIDAGVPYISANCLANDAVDMEKAKYLSPKRAAKLRKGFAKSGDVLFAHNATVGPVAILDTCEEDVILGTSLTYYRCNPEFIYPQYLAHYMRSSEFVRQYSLVMRQSTRNQVPITKQREFVHVVPPIDQQREIAAALDEMLQHRDTLGMVCDEKIALLDELKQSILHKAFAGELTADPKAADRTLSEASL